MISSQGNTTEWTNIEVCEGIVDLQIDETWSGKSFQTSPQSEFCSFPSPDHTTLRDQQGTEQWQVATNQSSSKHSS